MIARACIVLTCLATPLSAQDLDALARDLGMILASEEPCELSYDTEAVTGFIDDNVPPDALGFSTDLQRMTAGQAYQIEDQTPSARAAHCRAVENAARHHGFIE